MEKAEERAQVERSDETVGRRVDHVIGEGEERGDGKPGHEAGDKRAKHRR